MKTNDIIQVLKEHRDVTQIILESAKDCKDFWPSLCEQVYRAVPSTIENGDNPISDQSLQCALQDFATVDSLEVVSKKGRILKRFANYWKEQKGFKLPDNVMGIIGDILQRHLNQQSRTFYYDFTDVIDWYDGQFGKNNSCWWGCHKESKEVYTENGGWGIRFYSDLEDSDGIGRTWILPRNGMLIGFNSYGVSRPQTSKVIKAIFAGHGIKLHYKTCSLENSQNDEIPYINGDSGFVLYPDDIDASSVPNHFDFDMQTSNSDNRVECHACDTRLDIEDGDYEYIDDRYYCTSCANDRFSSCEHCGEWYDTDDVHKTNDDNWLCEYCAKLKGYVECYECQDWTDVYQMDSDGDSFCEYCADTHLTHCDHCEEYFYGDSHEGNCPATLNYSGLIESREELHAQIRTPNYTADFHQAVVYRVEGCKGLTLYNPHSINSECPDEWNISHDASGLAIKSGLSFVSAKKLIIALAELTDWTRSSEEIIRDTELMQNVMQAIREATEG